MPLYEYTCRGCGASFERRRSFEQRLDAQSCPACGHADAELHFSAPAKPAVSGRAEPAGFCPGTGAPCGCGHAVRPVARA